MASQSCSCSDGIRNQVISLDPTTLKSSPVAYTSRENLAMLETEHVSQMWSERLINDEHVGLYLSPCASAVAELVHAMFRSGNNIPVERITITRAQYLEACDADNKS